MFRVFSNKPLQQFTASSAQVQKNQKNKCFGNECNTIGEIMLQRDELQISHSIITHARTNLNTDELEDIYGIRVRSRWRSMFNLISFPEAIPDKRK